MSHLMNHSMLMAIYEQDEVEELTKQGATCNPFDSMVFERKKEILLSLVILFSLIRRLCVQHEISNCISLATVNEFHVGEILNKGSWVGTIGHSFSYLQSMVFSDFYNGYNQIQARVIPHTRDSKGGLLRALSTGLLGRMKVDESKPRVYRYPEKCGEALSEGSASGGIAADFDEIPNANLVGSTYKFHFRLNAAVGHATIKAKRLSYVDFTSSYTESGVSMIVPAKDKKNMQVTKEIPPSRTIAKYGVVHKLKIGVPKLVGFEELVNVKHDPQTNATTVTGFCIDAFKASIEALPYEVPYELVPYINGYGESAGSHNDLIDQVYLQKYDAVVGDMTITANRSLYADFTIPYTDLGVGVIVRMSNNKNLWIFLKPFTAALWLTSLCFSILTGFVVWIIEHPINDEFQGSPSQQIGVIFWFSFSTFVFAHREKLLSNLSRFVVIVWVFVVLILTSSYTATLTSMLTVQHIQSISNGNYIGYQAGPVVQGVVSNLNFKDPRLRPYNSIEQYAEALSKGSKHGGVSAIVDEIPYIKIFLAKYSADYSMIESKSSTNGFGFVFRKGSPLVSDISAAISKLREDGKLVEIENKWFKSSLSSCVSQDSASDPKVLNMDSFRGLFLISGTSLALALLAFLLQEKWHVVKTWNFRNIIWQSVAFVKKYLPSLTSIRNQCRIPSMLCSINEVI